MIVTTFYVFLYVGVLLDNRSFFRPNHTKIFVFGGWERLYFRVVSNTFLVTNVNFSIVIRLDHENKLCSFNEYSFRISIMFGLILKTDGHW